MKLCHRYIRESDKLPRIQDVPDDGAAVAKVRLFNPTGAGTWWIAGYDHETGQCFGAAEITDRELGYFDIAELAAFRGIFGLRIERDLHFKPTKLSDIV